MALGTYVKGLGIEDLEGGERFFSVSNGMASSTRYASRFHRQQKIVNFIQHHGKFETYPNLSLFLPSLQLNVLISVSLPGCILCPKIIYAFSKLYRARAVRICLLLLNTVGTQVSNVHRQIEMHNYLLDGHATARTPSDQLPSYTKYSLDKYAAASIYDNSFVLNILTINGGEWLRA